VLVGNIALLYSLLVLLSASTSSPVDCVSAAARRETVVQLAAGVAHGRHSASNDVNVCVESTAVK